MTPPPLVSVVICFLNEERFLEEAIQSVIQQTYQHWELHLVDDGSNDGSTAIAKRYAHQFPDKFYYSEHTDHNNYGLSASRNLGIAKAAGDLVAFLDADDIWMPEKLQVQVDILMDNPKAGMLCEAALYWYSWLDKNKTDEVIQVGQERDQLFEPPQLFEMVYPFSNGAAPCPSGIIIKKSVLQRIGGFEVQFKNMYEDQAFLFKIYLNESVYISSVYNHKYRQREGSILANVTKEGSYHQIRKFFLLWALQYMRDNKIKKSKVKDLIKQALFPYQHPFLYLILYRVPGKGKKLFQKLFRKTTVTLFSGW